MAEALAEHYADALANGVFAPNSGLAPEDAVAQFNAVESVISGSKDIQLVLLSPAVGKLRKKNVIADLADQLSVHRLIRNFLFVVVMHRRIRELRAMRRSFEMVVDERLGWAPAEITSAKTLDNEQRQEVERVLGTKLGKFIRATYHIDPSLIGGVRARVASKEYDASVRGKLESLRQHLTA
jgi:F-type H+-transporting ATPase subunit delta